ncbi:MAG TPA: hypothetical protein QF730_09295 [Planctomycetota bacterium]|jgi:hypothetical protein|nr:hypothetical protein [Planctomycetota bacterium]
MRTPSLLRPGQLLLIVALAAGLHACLAAPPAQRVSSPAGVVRADTRLRAAEVAALLSELKPAVLGALPHSVSRSTEVWVQPEPRLYTFPGGLHADAEGLWAGRQGRIHLRADADDLKRTLAHELVHASLDESWEDLPGSLEEGLCDLISTRLCPESAPRLRAGRLSGAAFACGGLDLSLTVTVPASAHPLGFEASYTASIQLSNGQPRTTDPMEVFETHAGLSSSSLGPWRKREFYGLSFLLVSRIAERVGLEGLHGLCSGDLAAQAGDLRRAALLELAALDCERETWRRAAARELGPAELREIARMYPDFILDTLARTLARCLSGGGNPDDVRAILSIPESGAELALMDLPELRAPLHGRLLSLLSGEGGLVALEAAPEEGEDRQPQ